MRATCYREIGGVGGGGGNLMGAPKFKINSVQVYGVFRPHFALTVINEWHLLCLHAVGTAYMVVTVVRVTVQRVLV